MIDREATRRDFLTGSLRIGAAWTLAGAASSAGAGERPAEAKAGSWQIGCYTRPWAEHDYRVALDAIAEAGFRHVGLMTTRSKSRLVISVETSPEEAARIGEEVKKRGLEIASVYGGGIPVHKSLQAAIAGLRRLIDDCAAAGSRTLLMGGVGASDLVDRYYKAIAECCDHAAAKGVGITLKPHGGLNATGPQCRKSVERVGHASFSLWYDPGNILYYSGGKLDPVEDSATVDGLVTGMCVKDYVHPKNVLVTPGTGRVDFPRVLARLAKGGFRGGPLVIETLAPGDLAGLAKQARQAREFVAGLVHERSPGGR